MKNFLFVAVALSVFTVTSLTASAQFLNNNSKSNTLNGEGIVYGPFEIPSGISLKSVMQVVTAKAIPFAVATEFCSKIQFKYAQLLNRDVELLTNTSLFGFINEWWGTKYRFGGSTKKGIDCSSFTGLLMNKVFGASLPRTARQQFAACIKLTREEMTEGDLIFFNTRGGVSHVGLYLGDGYFAHSSCSAGVTINSLEESYYKKRFIAGGRPQIAEDCYEENM
ncbi:MAG: C40 family peptidase [Ferruginibacter sp.]